MSIGVKTVFTVFYFITISKFIMSKNKKLNNSQRKFIRKEKARIRREVLDIKKQEEEIEKLYLPIAHDRKELTSKKNDNK